MIWIELYVKNAPLRKFHLQGNYVFGRSKSKCDRFALALNSPVNVVVIPLLNISGFHAVLCSINGDYQIVDGWGDSYSTNGVFVNGVKVDFAILSNRDEVKLASSDVRIIYHEEVEDILNEEKSTLQNLPEI